MRTGGYFDPVAVESDVLGVPVWLMRCVEVKPGAKLVFAALAGMLTAAGFVVTTRVAISEVTGLGTGMVRKHVSELIDGGMLLMSGATGDLDEQRFVFVQRDWMRSDNQIEGDGGRDEMDG